MKQVYYKISASNRFQAVVVFLRRELGMTGGAGDLVSGSVGGWCGSVLGGWGAGWVGCCFVRAVR
jgi:hypothetical protein